jgi:hypothetical protein
LLSSRPSQRSKTLFELHHPHTLMHFRPIHPVLQLWSTSLGGQGLVDREAYVFVYVFAPLPIVGATGSPGNPIAVL